MDRLLTAEEIAERLGMKTQWVWAQARAGLIPHVRLGRYVRFDGEQLLAWARNRTRGPAYPLQSTNQAAPARLAPPEA